jgi:formiminoglutamate deiminase
MQHALLPGGWARDVVVSVSQEGTIASLRCGPREAGMQSLGVVIPGLPNLHSHAFQRAMAGLTEVRASDRDSFWTWREVMYRFVQRLQPEDMAAIAAQAYVEMLEAGFTRVCEFHYLHHDAHGRGYADPACMAGALADAARCSGIGLSLLPVFYAQGGFGAQPAQAAQRRFVNDEDGFARLHQACAAHLSGLPGSELGLALHSLRAVTPGAMQRLLDLHPDGPVHIHVAEQEREVQECLRWSGRRPVQWLLENAPVGPRWCLVHATHMTADERDALAASGAVAGICPLTEANLGDGVFDGVRYRDAGGRFGVGTDSNTRISAAGELAMLEYSQRLRDRRRNLLVDAGSTGQALLHDAAAGGALAGGVSAGAIAAGNDADFVTLDSSHPGLVGARDGSWLDGWIFGAAAGAVEQVWVRGTALVRDGVHRERASVARRFAQVMNELAG